MREGRNILFNTKIVNLIFYIILVILVITSLETYNLQVTKAQFFVQAMLVETSETVRMLSNCSLLGNNDLKIREWIAGIIDGDGNFHISKKGYVDCSNGTSRYCLFI